MSISSVGSSVNVSSLYQSPAQQRRQDFQQLSQALKSGDLSGAQSAFAALTQNLSASPAASNSSSIAGQLSEANTPLGQDLAALGKALQDGDLSGAKQDFAKLQNDLKSQFGTQAHGAHHRGHHAHVDSDGDNDESGGASNAPDSTSSNGTISVTG